jgi:hypothetical protein
MRTLYRMHEIGGDPPDPPNRHASKSLGRKQRRREVARKRTRVAGPLPPVPGFSVVPGFSCLANTSAWIDTFVQ